MNPPELAPTRHAPARLRRMLPALGVALLVCIVFVIAAWAILISLPNHIPDFMVYWLGGSFLARGDNPYDAALWLKEIGEIGWLFFYPLPLAVLFIPWSLLAPGPAYAMWMFFSMACILSAVLLLLSTWRISKPLVYLPPILAAVIIFRPMIVSIRNGQIGGLFLWLLSLTAILWGRKHWALGGAAAGLLMLKPSLGAPILILLGLYLLMKRQWRGLLGMVGVNVLLFFLGWLFDPQWVGHFLANSNQKLEDVFGISPTLWGAAHLACDGHLKCTLPVGVATSIVLAAAALFLMYRLKPRSGFVVGLAIAVGLLVTPYGWAYEQVLLIAPILIGMGVMAHARKPFLLTGLTPVAFSVIALALLGLAVAAGNDVASLLIPALCLAFTIWAMYTEKTPNTQSR